MSSHLQQIIFLSLAISTFGCTYELANPLLGNDMTYMAKPVVSDSVPWGTYISGHLNISDGFNVEDANNFWELDLHQSYTFKSGNIALGAFGYRGAYHFEATPQQNLPDIQNRYSYYGGGFRGSLNFTVATEKVDLRFIGVDAVWSKEWGDFLSLRKSLPTTPDFISISDDELLTTALTSEVCIKLRPESQLAVKLYLGHVHAGEIETPETFGDNFLAANVFYSYHSLITSAQISLIENYGIKIGFGYRLH